MTPHLVGTCLRFYHQPSCGAAQEPPDFSSCCRAR
uniref:Uncharacterized protein n=1 Tax=Setaria italica TaxID=4555 RepID=K4AP95_SETIT